jgi:hypothetical protein
MFFGYIGSRLFDLVSSTFQQLDLIGAGQISYIASPWIGS